jgi:hypothetical protein
MNTGRYVIGSIVVFLFFLLANWLFHGVLLTGWYGEAPELIRANYGGGTHGICMLAGFLILAFGFCFIFLKGYENKGVLEGFRYGLYVGITFCISASLIHYPVFPFPGKWFAAWVIGYPIQMILAGMIFAAVYKSAPAK